MYFTMTDTLGITAEGNGYDLQTRYLCVDLYDLLNSVVISTDTCNQHQGPESLTLAASRA